MSEVMGLVRGIDAYDVLAVINRLGGRENWDGVESGRMSVTVEDAIRLLVDKHGRRIPEDLQSSVRDANRSFFLEQPELSEESLVRRIQRLHECLSIDTGITAEQFMAEYERLRAIIEADPQVANLTNGVCLPVILPQLTTNDLGMELDRFLVGVANSYVETFSGRKFINQRKGTLANQVGIVDGSRHEQLIERMKQGPVTGLSFPTALQGFSINADREQMLDLREGFVLGGMNIPVEMIMYPDILARDYLTPGLDLAALQWRSAVCSLLFKANDGGLDFGATGFLSYAGVVYSGGLLFLG